MKWNIIVVLGTEGEKTRCADMAIMAALAVGIRPHITEWHTPSGKTYWRKAKTLGLFPGLAEPWPTATQVYVVNEQDDICAGAIDPSKDDLARSIAMIITPNMPAIQLSPSYPMSPLAEDAMNGPPPQ